MKKQQKKDEKTKKKDEKKKKRNLFEKVNTFCKFLMPMQNNRVRSFLTKLLEKNIRFTTTKQSSHKEFLFSFEIILKILSA